jgi:hypothetical protein
MSVTVRMQDGDLEFESAGEGVFISAAEKAAQDLLEEILLPYDVERDRGNEMFEADGSLTSIAGSVAVGQAAVKSMIRSSVRRLMRAQASDTNTDYEETIQKIATLVVQAMQNDPTGYTFALAVDVDDARIALARAIRMNHLGNTTRPLVGGFDP